MVQKTILLLSSIFLCLTGIIVLPGLAFSQNVSPYDFDYPESSFLDLQIELLEFSASKRGDNPASLSGRLNWFFTYRYNSLKYAGYVYLQDTASLNRVFNNQTQEYELDKKLFVNFNPGFLRYLSDLFGFSEDIDLFGFFDIQVAYNYPVYIQPRIDSFLGLGYGRYYDITPLAIAVQIEEYLLETDDLITHMPKRYMLALGELINKRNEYKANYPEDYQGYWLEDMIQIIMQSGVVAGETISAMGILRMRQVLFPEDLSGIITSTRVMERQLGWEVKLGGAVLLSNEEEKGVSTDPVDLKLVANMALPLGWMFLWSEHLEASTKMTRDMFQLFYVKLTSDFDFEVSDYLDISLYNTFTIKRLDYEQGYIWGLTIGLSFIFYIESYISINISGNLDRSEERATEWEQRINVKLIYDVF